MEKTLGILPELPRRRLFQSSRSQELCDADPKLIGSTPRMLETIGGYAGLNRDLDDDLLVFV